MLLGFIMGKLGADEEKFVDRLQLGLVRTGKVKLDRSDETES